MMDNEYPNDEFTRRTENFRDDLEAFMKTTDDEGNPNLDYTFEDQKKLYESMLDKAYDLALFIEQHEADGYRLVKADADPVQAVVPDDSPAPALDDGDDEWLQDVLSDDDVSPTDDKILCPKCGSPNWRCWDEQPLYTYDKGNYEVFQSGVVAYLRCSDCGIPYGNREGEGETSEDLERIMYGDKNW